MRRETGSGAVIRSRHRLIGHRSDRVPCPAGDLSRAHEVLVRAYAHARRRIVAICEVSD